MKLGLFPLLAILWPVASPGATTVFSDTFAASTLNGTSNPTAASTSYDVASTKAATSSIAAGNLKLAIPSTTSGFVEAQARFAATPITLAATGDSVELMLTFVATTNLVNQGSGAIGVGLFNSGGSAPLKTLQSSGLSNVQGSASGTGGAQLWQGYNARISYTGLTNFIATRAAQDGALTGSDNQELLFNAVGGGAYKNPAGSAVGSAADSTLSLASAATYTLDLKVTYNAESSALTIDSNLYSGAGTAGPNLFTQTGVASGLTLLTTTFDSLSFGYRFANSTAAASQMDIKSLVVLSNLAVPEPCSSLLLLGGLAFLGLSKRQRR